MTATRSNAIASHLVSNRWFWSIFSLCLVALLTTGITRSGFDTSLEALLTRSDPYLDEVGILYEEFPVDLEISYVFIPPEGESVFSPAVLAALDSIEQRYNDIPQALRVSTVLSYFSPERQERLFARNYLEYSLTELAAIQSLAVNDRLLTNNLLATDAALTFATVSVDDDNLDNEQRLEIARNALELRDQLRGAHPDVTIHVSSDVILEQSGQQAMVDDLTQLLPIIIIICVAVMGFCFRSVWLAGSILSHQLFTLLSTLGLLGYLGFDFNNISIIAPLVVVIIAVANSVHIISIFRQAQARGEAGLQAMRTSLRANLQPVTLAALTTAIGFSSLNMSSSPAIQDFGRIVAIGIGFAYLLTLTMLPTLLVLISRFSRITEIKPFGQRGLLILDKQVAQHDRKLFWSYSLFALLTLALLPLNETDFNRLDFITADSDISDYYEAISERMNRGPAMTYAINTGITDGAIDPLFLQRTESFSQRLVDDPEIVSIASALDVIKTINQYQHQENPEFYVLPEDINTIGFYLNNYELVQSPDFPLSTFINDDFSIITLFINAVPLSNQELIDLDTRITEEFTQVFPEAQLLHGSNLLLFSRMDELVTIELLQGYTLSLILITLCLIVGLRSVYFGILSVIPNLLPATMVFGVWALFVGQLDPFVMMLFSISIGLVVDDTVHILSHYLEARETGSDQSNAISHAIRTAGPALTITTLILALGTTLLISANTIYFQQAAKLLVPIVVLALILDLTYLPGILKRFDKSQRHH